MDSYLPDELKNLPKENFTERQIRIYKAHALSEIKDEVAEPGSSPFANFCSFKCARIAISAPSKSSVVTKRKASEAFEAVNLNNHGYSEILTSVPKNKNIYEFGFDAGKKFAEEKRGKRAKTLD